MIHSKLKWLFFIFIVLCFIVSASASASGLTHSVHESSGILSPSADADIDRQERGQLLYRAAVQKLEDMEKRYGSTAAKDQTLSIAQRIALIVRSIRSVSGYMFDTHEENTRPLSGREHDLQVATRLLKKAGKVYGNKDALQLMAEMNFFKKYSHPRNFTEAFEYYKDLADTGNATAQQMLGFMYAAGVGHVVQRDQALALLYHTFAAHGDDTAAQMTLGYRHLQGIGVEQKCEDALYHYRRVAEKAINYYLSGPPGGHHPPLPKVRLSDDVGGVYGHGASMMSDKRLRPGSSTASEKALSIDEVLQYWRYLAQTKSDIEAQLTLGQVFYHGTRSIPQNFQEAHYFFQLIAQSVPSGKIKETLLNSKQGRAIGQAAGYLGKMYWRGEGVEADPEVAYEWFYIGAEFNDAMSQNGLGMMYLDGVVVPQNREKAIEYFKRAAEQENADAQVNLAIEYAKHEATLPLAIRLFTMAAESKHLLAYWYLAEMNYAGIGLKPSCQVAVSFYKSIAERGDWELHTVEDAYNAYTNGDIESAILYYMLAAERGYEVAQSNVAFLLDTDKQLLNLKDIFGFEDAEKKRDEDDEYHAFVYWSRSANQNNVDSRVKLGDYHFHGIGTPVDYEKAAACYRTAAEIGLSPMAMWNLGWMYENGLGVPKDFHLAKRAYDSALSTTPDAYLPVKLSLMKLYLRYYWGWITGTERGQELTRSNDDENDADRSSHWGSNDEKKVDLAAEEARRLKEIGAYERESERWEIGSEEELRRRYSKHLKQLEKEENSESMQQAGYREYDYTDDDDYSEDDELIENILILGLCILVGWLIYMRQFRFNNNQQPGGNNNN